MAATTEPRSGIKYGWGLGFNGWHTEMDDNLKLLGRFGFHLSVKDKDLTAPPGSPAAGDSYIVAAGASGAWAGKDGQVALWDGAAWVFAVPRVGWLANVEDEDSLYKRGASAWAVASAGGAPAQPFDATGFYPGVPTGSAKITRFPVARAVAFLANFGGSVGKAGVATTSSATFDIQKNGVSVGSMVFAAGATVATFSGAAVNFAAGDLVSIIAPASPDATLADVSFVLTGTR